MQLIAMQLMQLMQLNAINCYMKGHISKACRNRTCQTDPPMKMPAY